MQMWTKSANSDAVKPMDIEVSGVHVIVRKNFVQVSATEEIPAHYEYDEWQMTKSQYEVYKQFETLINEQSDALIELADLISEIVE